MKGHTQSDHTANRGTYKDVANFMEQSFLEKVVVIQLVKKFPYFHGT